MQPWCTDCSTTSDLTVDHIVPKSEAPELVYEMANLAVRCRSCNSKRGTNCTDDERKAVQNAVAARKARTQRFYRNERENAAQTRGATPDDPRRTPVGKARSALHTPRRCV